MNTVNILIVDDKPANLLALQAAFKGCSYNLIEALSGKEALEHANHYDFACAILDVQMPVMDGFELAMKLRMNDRSKNTPILFVTAITRSDEFENSGYIAGAVDYLFKPINPDILRAKVAVFAQLYLQKEEIKNKNKLLEEALAKASENQKLREALEARDTFLSMASHELKTPLTPLQLQMESFIFLIKNGKLKEIEEERLLRMLLTSHGQVERLSKLINELLDVSRITTGKLELQKEEVNLIALTENIVREFKVAIERAGSKVDVIHSYPVKGYWDPFRIEQVIINLLTNAIKYGEGKPIHISIDHTSSGEARLAISDRGIGIALEDQQRIFQRFERAVSGSNYSGLGLGLFISEQIVQLHKGKISVESQKGSGSKFIVELPILG